MRIGSQASLFSLHVESLYTNIETQRGLAVVKCCLQRYPQEGRPDESLFVGERGKRGKDFVGKRG